MAAKKGGKMAARGGQLRPERHLSGQNAESGTAFRPWRRGKPLDAGVRQIIGNLCVQMQKKFPEKSKKELYSEVSELLGIGVASIKAILGSARAGKEAVTPGKMRPGRVGKYTRLTKYDDDTKCAIRRKVHDFFRDRVLPTVVQVVDAVGRDPDLPDVCRRTILRLMNDLGFKFVKHKQVSIVADRDDIIEWRRSYLRDLRQYRSEGRKIFYVGEKRVTPSPQRELFGVEATIESSRRAFLDGLGESSKSGSELRPERLQLLHAGGAGGFVPDCLRLLGVKQKTEECYGAVDSATFNEWFETDLLPSLPAKSVIVLGGAPGHSEHVERFPEATWIRTEIQRWLRQHKVQYDEDMVKWELLGLAEPLRATCQRYVVDETAKKAGHVALRLPPYHGDLNPIELAWTYIEGHLTTDSQSDEDIDTLVHQVVQSVTPEMWAKYIEHAQEVEKSMWELDAIQEEMLEGIVPGTADDGSDSDNPADNGDNGFNVDANSSLDLLDFS